MDSSSEVDEDYVVEKNPLLIDMIIERLMYMMDFISLMNVKSCRLVCHKWNCFAEPVLKKRGQIVFNTSFRPSDFMALFSQPHHLAQPFTAFSFVAGRNQSLNFRNPDQRWTLSEINEFFTKWGKYIKKLDLSLCKVWLNRDDQRHIHWLNIDHLFESMGSNLEDFVLVGCLGSFAAVEVSLHKLSSVKNVCLDKCYIKLDSFDKRQRLTPSKFKAVDVLFRLNEKTEPSTIINDFVDLSRCSEIDLKRESSLCGTVLTAIKFDFSTDFVNCNQIKFDRIVPLNVKKSITKTDRLLLCICPTEPVQIDLKELELRYCTIDLTLISGKIEKLTMIKCDVISLDILPLDLPNLKFLSLTLSCDGTASDSSAYEIVSLFVNCENLSDLELIRMPYYRGSVESELDVNYLPKNVKILKFGKKHGLKFVGNSDPIEVDVLILADEGEGEGDSENNSSMKKVLERIKTKVLIRAFFPNERFLTAYSEDTVSQFIADIVQDKKLQKTIVELKHGPHFLKTLELVDQSKTCKDSSGKGSLMHEFNGRFLKRMDRIPNNKFGYVPLLD